MSVKKIFLLLIMGTSIITVYAVLPGSVLGKVYAAARLDVTCNQPDAYENSVFPYGFFCGSAGTRYDPVKVTSPQATPDKLLQHDNLTDKFGIDYGTSYVDVDIFYRGEGIPRTSPGGAKAQVMVWSTIDAGGGQGDYVQSATALNGSNSHSNKQCPGAGSTAPGVVYGQGSYGSDSPHPQSSDASPYGWDGTSGQVNCDSGGKMVYWDNKDAPNAGSTSDTYKYRIQLNPTQANFSFCVRGDVSVHYGGDPFPATGSDNNTTDNSTASHLARQSSRLCFQVGPKPTPPPTAGNPTAVGSCTKTKVDVPDKIIPQGAVNPRDASAVVTIARTNNNTTNYVIYGDDDHTWQYAAADQTIAIKVTFRWKDSNGNWKTDTGNPKNIDSPNISCWHASCSIGSITGDGPNGSLLKGGTAHIRVNMLNDGPQTLYSKFYDQYPNGGAAHTISATNGDGAHSRGFGINRGGTEWIDVDVAVPNAVGYFSTSFTPEYSGAGGFRLGPDCGTGGPTSSNTSIYEGFNVGISAKLAFTGGSENPSAVSGSSAVQISGTGRAVNVDRVYTRFYKVSGPDYVNTSAVTFAGNAETTLFTNSQTPSPYRAGDKFCTDILAPFTSGLVGPGGSGDIIITNDDAQFKQQCDVVHNEPYVHMLGADVSAGGGFGTNCTNTNAGIQTYLRDVGNPGAGILPAGSGVQLGALAIGPANGFSSAMLRGSSPTGPTGLSFANTVHTGGSGTKVETGGNLGGNHCMTDYYAEKSAGTVVDSTTTRITGVPVSNSMRYTHSLTIDSPIVLSAGTKKTIYVDGDVRINGNITYDTNYQTIDNIPSLTIVSKGGSIYVDNNVTQLDGTYVAQPADTAGGTNNGAGGNIYTCAIIAYGDVLNNCNNQLVINGSFAAQHVYLLRSYGSLRDSQSGERLSASGRNCQSKQATAYTANGDCAAEIFNYSPEAYLGNKETGTQDGPTTGVFDYITSLPPIL